MNTFCRCVAGVVSLLVMVAGATGARPKPQPLKPGRWRWKVKTLQDDEARSLKNMRKPVSLTVADANRLVPPRTLTKQDGGLKRGVGREEFIVYRVTAKALAIKLEPDGDYHLLLQDLKTKDKLGVEIVKPEFAAKSSKRRELAAARVAVEKTFAIPASTMSWEKYQRLNEKGVTLTGVGFWDMREEGHYSPGSKSGFELHPVLSVTRN